MSWQLLLLIAWIIGTSFALNEINGRIKSLGNKVSELGNRQNEMRDMLITLLDKNNIDIFTLQEKETDPWD